MFIFGLKLCNTYRINIDNLITNIKPYLKHGSVILSSDLNIILAYLSPSPIKHCSFCYIDNNEYYIIDISDEGYKEYKLYDFLKTKNNIFIYHYMDLEIMKKTMNYIKNYKHSTYGFTSNKKYCYKLLYDIYNDVYGKKYKNISDFIQPLKIFGNEYINSNSLVLSKNFYLKCSVINNYVLKF